MIYDLGIAWRQLVTRPLQTAIPIVVAALAIGLSIVVLSLSDGVRQGIIRASDPFGVLVVGAKGSGQQLVFNTILLQGLPVGNIRQDVFTRLKIDPRVALAVPLAMGDNVGGARIIGTDASLFQLRTDVNAPATFQFAVGGIFTADFEAVLGAAAADALGLDIGDQFRGAHGVEAGLESDIHEQVYTVVGILKPTNSPYDKAVLTTIETVWAVHAGEVPGLNAANIIPSASASDDLTAVLVRPVGFSEANQLWQAFYTSTEAQAVFPGQELGAVFDLLGQAVRVLSLIGGLVLGIAGATMFLAMFSAISAREHAIAIMRSLGASRLSIVRMILAETLLLGLAGALLGRVLGYSVAWLIASTLTAQSAIAVPVRWLPELEVLLWLFPLAMALIAGLIPAWQAYHTNVVEKLFSS